MTQRRMTTAEYAALHGVTLADARLILAGEKTNPNPPPPRVRAVGNQSISFLMTQEDRRRASHVLDNVCLRYGCAISELLGPRRGRKISEPRHMAMAIVRDICGSMSLPMIAAYFCRADHTTVMHACKRHEYKRKASAEYAALADRLTNDAANL